jgi:hypothetical protein
MGASGDASTRGDTPLGRAPVPPDPNPRSKGPAPGAGQRDVSGGQLAPRALHQSLAESRPAGSGPAMSISPLLAESVPTRWLGHRRAGCGDRLTNRPFRAAPRPDSEHFRFAPRTCPAVRCHSDRAEVGASVYDQRRSTMNEQAVQERRRGLNIAEVVFYSVLVLLVMLLSVYVPA